MIKPPGNMTVAGYLVMVGGLYLLSIVVFAYFTYVLLKYSREPIKQKSKGKPRILKER